MAAHRLRCLADKFFRFGVRPISMTAFSDKERHDRRRGTRAITRRETANLYAVSAGLRSPGAGLKRRTHFPYYISAKMTPQTDIARKKNLEKIARGGHNAMQLPASQGIVTSIVTSQ